jgi:hypothetical protein
VPDLPSIACDLSSESRDLTPIAGDLSPIAGDLSSIVRDLSPKSQDRSPNRHTSCRTCQTDLAKTGGSRATRPLKTMVRPILTPES